MTVVTPLSFSQRNSRRNSARRIVVVRQAGKERLDRVEHDALGADRSDRVVEPDEEPFEVVLARFLDLAAFDVDVVDGQLARPRPDSGRSKPSDATSLAISSAFSSNVMNTPGSSNWTAPLTRNVSASSVLPDPGPPQTSVGRPLGSPPRVISSSPRIPVRVFASSRPRTRSGSTGGIARHRSECARRPLSPTEQQNGHKLLCPTKLSVIKCQHVQGHLA